MYKQKNTGRARKDMEIVNEEQIEAQLVDIKSMIDRTHDTVELLINLIEKMNQRLTLMENQSASQGPVLSQEAWNEDFNTCTPERL